MKPKLILLLCCLATVAFGQSVHITVRGVSKDSITVTSIDPPPSEKTYVPFPSPPAFENPNKISISGNYTVAASTLGGKSDQVLTGTATTLTLSNIVGTAAKPIRFSGAIVKGTSTTQRSVRTLNSTYYIELYKSTLTGNNGGFMLSTSMSAPGGAKVNDLEILDTGFAGYWCNSTGIYDWIDSYFLRVKRSGGEALYLGNTDRTKRSKIKRSHHEHLFIDSAGWDGIQVTSVDDLLIRKATVIGAGYKGAVGQNRLLQVQMSNGKIVKSLFMGSPSSVEITTNDLLIDSCYFGWNNQDRIYIGNPGAEAQINGKPIIIDHSYFNVPVGSAPLIVSAIRNADLIVRNSMITDNIKSLFTDNRGSGATNKLIDGGGNTFVPAAKFPVPVLKPLDGELVVADDFYYPLGLGWRNPK